MYIGTGRKDSRTIALILIVLGLILTPDFIIPTFTDWIVNVPLAMWMSGAFQVSYITALFITFAFGFALLFAGFLIYPYNTKRMITGHLKRGISAIRKNPLLLVISIIIVVALILVGQWFYESLWNYVKTLILT